MCTDFSISVSFSLVFFCFVFLCNTVHSYSSTIHLLVLFLVLNMSTFTHSLVAAEYQESDVLRVNLVSLCSLLSYSLVSSVSCVFEYGVISTLFILYILIYQSHV